MNEIVSLLTRDGLGSLPRRATVASNERIDDICNVPGATECTILSRLCELIRESRGEQIYSRDPSTLLRVCLQSNDEKAWKALCDDVMCGLVDGNQFRRYFEERPEDVCGFVLRIQGAVSVVQCACIVRVFSECVCQLSDEATGLLCNSLRYGHGTTFLASFATHVKCLPSKARTTSLVALGNCIVIEDVFDILAKHTCDSIDSHPHAEDLLTILMASPCASRICQVSRDSMTIIHSLALQTPVSRRAPFLKALSYMATPNDSDLHGLVLHTLKSCGESRELVQSAAKLAQNIESPASLPALLAEKLSLACII